MLSVGIDEVGRGCWAGPLVAGAVLFDQPIPGLKDSKKLNRAQREYFRTLIEDQALAYGLGWVDVQELDRIGLTNSVRLAMERALQAIDRAYDEIIIDGSYNFLASYDGTRTMINADDIVPAVSAASILAKVVRDDYMLEAATHYPGYGFDTNVGYGTARHVAGLQRLGVTDLHRRSFKPIQALL